MEEGFGGRLRARSLLEHFADIKDERASWRIMYPLPEVLLLVVCGSIAGCDDYDEIAEWGEAHLDFLKTYAPYDWGVPCEDWLRTLMNRLDPKMFSSCFTSWVQDWFGVMPELIALDGKTARRSHDRKENQPALHTVSAFAGLRRLVLGQEAVADKSSEHTAIPALLERLALKGALVTIDALGCNPTIATAILAGGTDYLLPVKGNQATLEDDLVTFFADPKMAVQTITTTDKGHGRLETRTYRLSHDVAWLHQLGHAFPQLAMIGSVTRVVEQTGATTTTTRLFISSAPLPLDRFAEAVRTHWSIENQLHWVLDVAFKEDLSRLRKGHGAKNMAVVRHFAINLVRNAPDKISLKTRRKKAGWSTTYLASLLNLPPR